MKEGSELDSVKPVTDASAPPVSDPGPIRQGQPCPWTQVAEGGAGGGRCSAGSSPKRAQLSPPPAKTSTSIPPPQFGLPIHARVAPEATYARTRSLYPDRRRRRRCWKDPRGLEG
ncbi:hypothetical protein GUJ93_ZPchr0016g2597 [Zizania palustris]|uniref:Uncharacterized protein n=1 Tax=Zizania palustris TaxID=103762 RepID=A0A8J5SZ06_ZIZPA|nr:hypothetical protein GUJ93_ZPchr0016g2597 [Zizania palustris]